MTSKTKYLKNVIHCDSFLSLWSTRNLKRLYLNRLEWKSTEFNGLWKEEKKDKNTRNGTYWSLSVLEHMLLNVKYDIPFQTSFFRSNTFLNFSQRIYYLSWRFSELMWNKTNTFISLKMHEESFNPQNFIQLVICVSFKRRFHASSLVRKIIFVRLQMVAICVCISNTFFLLTFSLNWNMFHMYKNDVLQF